MPILFILVALFSSASAFSQGLTKAEIQKVSQDNQDQIQSCLTQYGKDPAAKGRLRAEIKVAKDGKVESVKTTASSFTEKSIGNCVESKVKHWTYPAPLANQPTTFSFPFIFGKDAPAALAPLKVTGADEQLYRGRIFKKSNRPIEDIGKLQTLAGNKLIKAKGTHCEKIGELQEICKSLESKDRVVCSALTSSPPRRPATSDWTMINHPDAFRVESNVYFLEYWHISCEELNK